MIGTVLLFKFFLTFLAGIIGIGFILLIISAIINFYPLYFLISVVGIYCGHFIIDTVNITCFNEACTFFMNATDGSTNYPNGYKVIALN